MAAQTYTDAGTAPRITMRFLAAPTDVNWGGKAHGGTVMRWIDEAAYAVGAGWCAGMCIAAYSGGVRFYRPIQIGHIVEVEARLLRTGRTSMHIAVHVRSGDPQAPEMHLTTHCLTVFVALDEHRQGPAGTAVAVRQCRGPCAGVTCAQSCRPTNANAGSTGGMIPRAALAAGRANHRCRVTNRSTPTAEFTAIRASVPESPVG